MTQTIIITICSLLLIAYLFDLTSSRTKIPSVVLLLLMGWILRQIMSLLDFNLPDFSSILPVLGTLGLILIVLEGSMELEFNKSKFQVISKSFLGLFFSMIILAFSIAYLFHYFGVYPFKKSLINAIPFCVISSAIAIPSARNLSPTHKEFTIYESSLSDIIGVLFFNFMVFNEYFTMYSFVHFGLQLLYIAIISLIAIIGLTLLLSRIKHHVKFAPIIFLVILIYAVTKAYHLPALIFILLFGLYLGNLEQLRRFKWMKKFRPEELGKEVNRFKELTIEATFLIRSLFFILFGYLIETSEIINADNLVWTLGIVFAILFFRIIQLKLSKLPLSPLLFIAPRGLITILLFLSISENQRIAIVNKSLIIQVIVLTALIMMFGLMTAKNKNEANTN